MKLAVLGTRGVPNYYGGFEQFAQYLSEQFVKKGHEVYVYNSHNHIYQELEWNGVKIIHCKDPEYIIGTVGQFIYDLNCIIDSRKRDFDVILQLGYTSSSIWNWLLPKKPKIVTNMDGLEWKRSKYSKPVQKFLLFAERLAVKSSDYLISDSTGIQSYLQDKYSVDSKYIPYGANLISSTDDSILAHLNLEKRSYSMIIARMEPENSIETILEGFLNSDTDRKFLVIGNTENRYGEMIKNKFNDDRIVYLGYISELEKLNVLRKNSYLYFHGHTVGGTNPSLLEAMSSSSLICAHNNEFNKAILENDAFYFNCNKCITSLLNRENLTERDLFTSNNIEKIKNQYSWGKVLKEYEDFLKSMI
tara:strand:+ start:665 stop:1747 length:1083 start_codon:yes stop_codon:yes gene_type:complete